MSQSAFDDDPDKEPPLDPAAERLQRKLKRLLAVSSLVMVLGFIAVFAAIVYRVTSNDAQAELDAIAATVAIGAGAEVVDIEVAEGRLIVLLRKENGTSLVYMDPATGREIGRTEFVPR